MAATKRRRHSTKRRRVRASNPKWRTRKAVTTTARRTRRRSIFASSRRRANPVRRRSVRRRARRRNPVFGSGVVGEGFKLGVAGMAIGFAQRFTRQLVGGFLPSGPIANAGVTLGTAYGLSWVAGFLPVNAIKNFKRPLELAGWTLAMTQLVTSYLLPALSNITGGAGLSGPQGWGGRRGVRGIGVTTNIPPYITAPLPAAAPPQSSGMQGIGVVPGANRWGR